MIDTTDRLLGEARPFTVGDRVVTIGWKRPHPMFRGSEYDYAPTGYITSETISRKVVKGRCDINAKQLRELAAQLNRYADTLDAVSAER